MQIVLNLEQKYTSCVRTYKYLGILYLIMSTSNILIITLR